jgi:putative SOS response-associated peptidase YedK
LPYDELELFLKERFNISPTQDVPIIRAQAGKLVTENIRWGLQPAWAKSPIINAQCEGILKKPTFKQSVLERRCLIPADGFYEWRGKTPFHFTLPNHELFYFAGILDEPTPAQRCCIITTAANDVVAPFHKRMPLILRPADYDRWLDPETAPAQLEEIFQHPDSAALSAKAVPPLVPDGAPPPAKSTQGEWDFQM